MLWQNLGKSTNDVKKANVSKLDYMIHQLKDLEMHIHIKPRIVNFYNFFDKYGGFMTAFVVIDDVINHVISRQDFFSPILDSFHFHFIIFIHRNPISY